MTNGTEGIRKQASELIEQAYNRGYKAGQEKAFVVDSDKYREQGRNEAWEAAGKLVSMGYKECNEVLGDGVLMLEYAEDIFIRCTASEAINKLRAYEEQKKQKEDNEIKVGDEVRCIYSNLSGIVTHISPIEGLSILWGDGSTGKRKNISDYKKTGRTFPEIAEVLKKMKEDEK